MKKLILFLIISVAINLGGLVLVRLSDTEETSLRRIKDIGDKLRQISSASWAEASELFYQLAHLPDGELASIFIQTNLANRDIYFDIYVETQLRQRFNIIFAKYDKTRRTAIYNEVLKQIDEFKKQVSPRISGDPLQTVLDVFNLPQTRVLLIGDNHILAQEDKFLVSIIDKVLGGESVDTIALEIPHDMQEKMNRFLVTTDNSEAERLLNEIKQGNPIVIQAPPYIDMLRHLRELSLGGMKLNVLCFDVTLDEQRAHGQINRENFMFSKIRKYLEANPGKKLLIFVGNRHTKKSADANETVEKRLGCLLNDYLRAKGEESFSVTPDAPIGYLLSDISDGPFGVFTRDLPLRLYGQGNVLQESWDYILVLK